MAISSRTSRRRLQSPRRRRPAEPAQLPARRTSPSPSALVIDNSGSMYDKRAAVNNAALDLVTRLQPRRRSLRRQLRRRRLHRSGLHLRHRQAQRGPRPHRIPRRHRPLRRRRRLRRQARRTTPGAPSRSSLIITDGEDNASTLNLEQAIRRVQQISRAPSSTPSACSSATKARAEAHRARRALELLSDETGGLAFFPKSLAEVDDIAAEVAKDIRNQYTIGYHSTKPTKPGGFRTVHVDAKAAHTANSTSAPAPATTPNPTPNSPKAPSPNRDQNPSSRAESPVSAHLWRM